MIQAGLGAEVAQIINDMLSIGVQLDDMQIYLGMLGAYSCGSAAQALALYQCHPVQQQDALLLAARIFYQQGQTDIATKMIDHGPIEEHPSALGLRAMIALDSHDEGLAMALASQALSQEPNQFDSLVVYASLANYQQQYEESASWVEQALKLMPDQGRLLSLKGQYLMQAGKLDTALPILLQATSNMPNHTGTVLLVGWCHLLKGQYDMARKVFIHACEMDRNFADSHGSLAVALFHLGELTTAQKEISIAKRLDPQSFSAAYAEALLLEQVGEVELAEKKIRQLYVTPHYSGEGTNWDVIQKVILKGKKVNAG
jgi:Tfp pilus assembly protein PilF